jgi:hypothetical protein
MRNPLDSRSLEAIDELWQVIGDLIDLQSELLASTGREDLRLQLDGIKSRFPKHMDEPTKLSEEAEDEPLRFEQISVERINIVEADGTLRLVISNKQRFPDAVVNGKVIGKREGIGIPAGIIFYDDEGSECGGLAYGGSQNADGTYQAEGSLTFDQFRQDQVICLQHEDVNGRRSAGLQIWDRAALPGDEWIEKLSPVFAMPDGVAKDAAFQKLRSEGLLPAQRIFVGKYDGNAAVSLFDGNSKVRLRMTVDQMGEARIEFLDVEGQITRTIKASE